MSKPQRIAGRAEEWRACCIQVQVLSRLSEMYESRPFLIGRWLRKKETYQTVRALSFISALVKTFLFES